MGAYLSERLLNMGQKPSQYTPWVRPQVARLGPNLGNAKVNYIQP